MNATQQKSPAVLLMVLAATLMIAAAAVLLLLHLSSETAPSPPQPPPNTSSVVAPQNSPGERHKKCRESILASAHRAFAAKEFEKAITILDNGESLCVGLLQDEEFLTLRAQAKREDQRAAPERKRQQARKEAIALAEGRRKIAGALRQRWLDQGVNIKVRVSGKQADRIVLTYPLFDEVWANRFNKPEELFWMLKAAGFKRVDLDNGWNYHQYWQLAQ